MLKVYPVLCRAGQMDNYSYILLDKTSGISAVVDPSEVAPLVNKLNELNLKPSYILNTHHHFDHTDGNKEIKKIYNAKVVGNIADSHRIPEFDIGISAGDSFMLGNSQAQIIDVSAHTQGHILWYFPEDKILFTGDTLFNLCIGGLFEGSAEQMFNALQKIKQLPDDVEFYPGHEYTLHGADFAHYYNQGNSKIEQYIQNALTKLQQGHPVCPTKLELEKQCNPYLQASSLAEFKKLF